MQQHRVMQVNFVGNGNGATHTAIILISSLPLTADCRYPMFMFIDMRSGECGVMQVNALLLQGGATHTLIVDS